MTSRGGFTGPPMNPNVHPMNVGHAAGMRMPGMPQPPMGYPRSMNSAPQYPQVGFAVDISNKLNQENCYVAKGEGNFTVSFFLPRDLNEDNRMITRRRH